jgi:non-ribosomal peptide synthetase component E (peptide arylation enzyme)
LSERSSPETRAFEGATNGAHQSRAAISIPGDVHAASPAKAWARALEITAQATRDPARILPRAAAEWADKYGDATALISDQERLSFRALEARMNQYSRWALGAGIARGETVALMMGNRPEYFAIWLGLISLRATAALGGGLLASRMRATLKAIRHGVMNAACAHG